ncbi:MAG: LLM class F420-dependent oxidoreductase, partial [Alphaproteobacteria bacterium]|nr:LLM class F420-dependent oxidoreductase [Alphaproteobacteria bacterium]
MKVLQTLPQHDLNAVPAAVKAAEESGFDMAVTMENKHDPFLPLAVAA